MPEFLEIHGVSRCFEIVITLPLSAMLRQSCAATLSACAAGTCARAMADDFYKASLEYQVFEPIRPQFWVRLAWKNTGHGIQGVDFKRHPNFSFGFVS
jgi:hypothetical protein